MDYTREPVFECCITSFVHVHFLLNKQADMSEKWKIFFLTEEVYFSLQHEAVLLLKTETFISGCLHKEWFFKHFGFLVYYKNEDQGHQARSGPTVSQWTWKVVLVQILNHFSSRSLLDRLKNRAPHNLVLRPLLFIVCIQLLISSTIRLWGLQ